MSGGISGLYPSLDEQTGRKSEKTFRDKVMEWNDTKSVALASEICDDLYYEIIESKYDTDYLVDSVIKWGREKKLDDPKAQLNKVMEEVGEIAREITRNKFCSPEVYDAIGDTLVTVIILSDILDIDPREALEDAYLAIAERKGVTEGGTFIKDEQD